MAAVAAVIPALRLLGTLPRWITNRAPCNSQSAAVDSASAGLLSSTTMISQPSRSSAAAIDSSRRRRWAELSCDNTTRDRALIARLQEWREEEAATETPTTPAARACCGLARTEG